ncbi:MAG: molybdopterin-synthase adenylyltransferase MoeB [Pseudomonadota bacterium]
MIFVGILAATLWGIGRLMGAPTSARWLMIGLLYVAVLAVQVALPATHPLRLATGESPAQWLIIGAFAGLVWLYFQGLTWLRSAANTSREPTQSDDTATGPFSDTELKRYARHIVLREVGGPGQVALKNAKVLVVGAGGLGAPVLQYLAAAGVGTIGVIDDDTVDGSNLQRQVIHRDAAIGMPKVFSAKSAIEALNPFVTVRPYNRRLTEEITADLVADYDIILDGSDNFETRYLVNAAAVRAGKPLISGALSQWEGQVSVFDTAQGTPCYQCVFPHAPAPGLAPSCAEAGVIGPLPGVVGSMMALEAVKLITGAGTPLRGQMAIYDGLYGENRTVRLKKRPDCPICGGIT